jgi:lycopene beta-cyclase
MDCQSHIVLAGAGCAGLAMASELLDRSDDRIHMTLIDPALYRPVSKTWSFWGKPHPLARPLIRHSWQQMAVSFPGWQRAERLDRNVYHCVDANDYRLTLLDRLRPDPRVTLVEDRVDEVYDLGSDKGVFVQAGTRTVHADWMFQSFRNSPPPPQCLKQHFVGWEIECSEANFDPNCFTLMDFDTAQNGAICFYYVLPFSPTRALVEHTTFSTNNLLPANQDLAVYNYLTDRIRGCFRRVRRERGVIPMTTQPLPPKDSDNVFNIGAIGGMTKPSTGYTFQRSLNQATHLARSIAKHNKPILPPQSPHRFHHYDTLFLRALVRCPGEGRKLFKQLFANNRFAEVLAFLAEETTPRQELSMLRHLPWGPILSPGPAPVRSGFSIQPRPLPSVAEAV